MKFTPNLVANHSVHTQSLATLYAQDEADKLNIPDMLRTVANIQIAGDGLFLLEQITRLMEEKYSRIMAFGDFVVMHFSRCILRVTLGNAGLLTSRPRHCAIGVYASLGEIKKIVNTLEQAYPANKYASVDWYHLADGGRVIHDTIKLDHTKTVYDEFFPWIKPSLEEFQKSYLASSANVLVLYGEPGCGKTSFLRNFIFKQNLAAMVTLDEELLKKDKFFIEFINDLHNDILIVEDADTILTNRLDGNRVMSKLLNASDGLIETKKKIVFTTNLSSLDDVDPALTRPGRCFEFIKFRELTHTQAIAAAIVAGVAEPDGPRTLSQLFQTGHTAKRESFGFSIAG